MPCNHLDYMTHIDQPNFFFRPIHCYSTEKLICSLINKSSNLNTIPVKILKSICDIICPCLTNIINKSLTTGVFHDSLQKARVTPIQKEGDKICNLSNYRPMSVLPVFSKVFEKVAYTQLYDYLENNSILHKQQGFRAKNFTTQAILHFLQYQLTTELSLKSVLL